MCTLSLSPFRDGYLVAMNRDERLSRVVASRPAEFTTGQRRSLYPFEPTGGTWLGVNDLGITFALLNRNSDVKRELQRVSRGTLIPLLLAVSTSREAQNWFTTRDLHGVLPFRLIGIFPRERDVHEWIWDFESIESKQHGWKLNQWFSSGASDEQAQRQRSLVCAEAMRQPNAGSQVWLRALHRSHAPVRGAFSICAHRQEAGTVSYTEIVVAANTADMSYKPGPACEDTPFVSQRLLLQDSVEDVQKPASFT
jgi:hypothetical protein